MKRLLTTTGVLGLALASLLIPVAAAGPPAAVHIAVETTIPDSGPAFGPFTTGPSGPLCPSGQVTDPGDGHGAGYQSGNSRTIFKLQLQIDKQFTCDDGSGTFVLKLQLHLQFVPMFSDVGTWTVVGGTGAYARLHGSGTLTGTPTSYGVLDVYDGQMEIS